MVEWWNALSVAGKIFSAIAIPATAVMILQTLLLLFGLGIDADVDGDGVPDADSDGMSLITIRGIVAFFSVGGWVGVVSDCAGVHIILSSLMAFAAGLIALIGVAVLFRSAMKLQASGNLDILNSVGKNGKVYIPVPPKNAGHGKINVLMQDRLVELEAVNDDDEVIKTDEIVEIISAIDSQTVLVKAKNKKLNAVKGGISKWESE